MLASKFRTQTAIRSNDPLSDDQIRKYAPSIFAEEKHGSRSARYTYVPTSEILAGLRSQGFSPFMACQSKSRDESKREHTKHMVRLRHASQINAKEANEIILLNSHDGTSAYQMMSGMFRFVCSNGLVCGSTMNDIRFRHNGDIMDNIIEGAFRVLDDFEVIGGQMEGMKSLTLNEGEQAAFARAALELKYDTELAPAPVTERQILQVKRMDDNRNDLWTTFNRVQENLIGGGLRSRTATGQRSTTRPVTGIDSSIKLNRALWVLTEEMRKMKA